MLGNTCYTFAELLVKVDDNAFVPASAIKNIRRKAISALEEKICEIYRRTENIGDSSKKHYCCLGQEENINHRPDISVGVATKEQLDKVINTSHIDNIIIDIKLYKSLLKDFDFSILKNKGFDLFLELPYIVKNDFDLANYLPNQAIDGIYIRNIDGLFAYLDYIGDNSSNSLKVICGDGLYAYNKLARDFIARLLPYVKFELPKELNKKELQELGVGNNQLVVYDHQQVMLSAQCVVKNRLGCNKSDSVVKLKDDQHNTFYAKACCDECCNVIYNGTPYMILNQLNDDYYKSLGINVIRFNFTVETKEDVDFVLNLINEYAKVKDGDYGKLSNMIKGFDKAYTSGHFNRGVE